MDKWTYMYYCTIVRYTQGMKIERLCLSVWWLAREVEDSLQSAVWRGRWEQICCRYDVMTSWPNYKAEEVAPVIMRWRGQAEVRSQLCGSLLTLRANWGLTLTLLMLSSDKWADYFLISQARNCWERPWRLWDRRQRPNRHMWCLMCRHYY